jgi:hypothetical protein
MNSCRIIPIWPGICHDQKDMIKYMGAATCDHVDDGCNHIEDDCACVCNANIYESLKGQTLTYGNIKFLDYCEKHMKSCNDCKSYDIRYMILEPPSANIIGVGKTLFYCKSCFGRLDMSSIK